MCGIAGLIQKKRIEQAAFDTYLRAAELMHHRGPDFNSHFQHENVLLIHYRLSIIDLDPRSNQPFQSSSGDYITVYNGEIYNFREVARKYAISQRTTSDTEVMLESYESAGNTAVPDWNGIFAAAILSIKNNKLALIRDRFGVKPLYYYEDENYIAFSSEAKVIYNWLPSLKINRNALAEYLWFGNPVEKETMVEKVSKIAPATIVEIDLKSFAVSESTYWNIPGTQEKSFAGKDIVAETRELLKKAVGRQLVSDVPLGILLSGGVDSSAITAFASRESGTKLDTYSVEYDYNIGGESELPRAAMIAKQYGTNHHELKVQSRNIPEIFDALAFQYDEPFADPASIPLYQLAKECSHSKKVILQGDGGDEIFAGYRYYNLVDWLNFWKITSSLGARFSPKHHWRERMKRMSFVLNQKDHGYRMAYLLTVEVPYKNPYDVLTKEFSDSALAHNPFQPYLKVNADYRSENPVQRLMYADLKILLPYTYLEKVDKATMLCSLESRVPFLDNDLVEFASALPSRMKIRKGQKKYLLKEALRGLVPDEILFGKKRGFDVPFNKWLKTDLYDYARQTFSAAGGAGILDSSQLIKLLEVHRSGKANYAHLLWKSLVLSAWINAYKGKLTSAN